MKGEFWFRFKVMVVYPTIAFSALMLLVSWFE